MRLLPSDVGNQPFVTALHDLQARPDPLGLLCSILPLFGILGLRDSALKFVLQISSLT